LGLSVTAAAAIVAVALCSAAAAAKPGATKPAGSYRASDQVLANRYATEEAGRLGVPLNISITVRESASRQLRVNGLLADAYAVPMDASGGFVGHATSCVITIAQIVHGLGANGKTSSNSVAVSTSTRSTIAHEVFHCLEFQLGASIPQVNGLGEWAIEGAATWVESDLVAGDDDAREWWAEYLEKPATPLFKRSYDAIGFFGHLAKTGVSPWKVFPAFFAAASRTAAYQVALSADGGYLDSEASVFFRDIELGPAWDPRGQGANADSNLPLTDTAGEAVRSLDYGSGTRELTVAPYADAAYALTLHAPAKLVAVTVLHGSVRLRATDGGPVDADGAASILLCRDGARCVCPETGAAPAGALRFGDGDLAIAAGPGGGSVRIANVSLDSVCQGCLAGRWKATSISGSGSLESIEGGAGTVLTIKSSGDGIFTTAFDYGQAAQFTVALAAGPQGVGIVRGTDEETVATTGPGTLSATLLSSNLTITVTVDGVTSGPNAATGFSLNGPATYDCTASALTINTSNNQFNSVAWTFARD
jgi:hypothetical protein